MDPKNDFSNFYSLDPMPQQPPPPQPPPIRFEDYCSLCSSPNFVAPAYVSRLEKLRHAEIHAKQWRMSTEELYRRCFPFAAETPSPSTLSPYHPLPSPSQLSTMSFPSSGSFSPVGSWSSSSTFPDQTSFMPPQTLQNLDTVSGFGQYLNANLNLGGNLNNLGRGNSGGVVPQQKFIHYPNSNITYEYQAQPNYTTLENVPQHQIQSPTYTCSSPQQPNVTGPGSNNSTSSAASELEGKTVPEPTSTLIPLDPTIPTPSNQSNNLSNQGNDHSNHGNNVTNHGNGVPIPLYMTQPPPQTNFATLNYPPISVSNSIAISNNFNRKRKLEFPPSNKLQKISPLHSTGAQTQDLPEESELGVVTSTDSVGEERKASEYLRCLAETMSNAHKSGQPTIHCHKCGLVKIRSLRTHIQVHIANPFYRCGVCGELKKDIWKHLKSIHPQFHGDATKVIDLRGRVEHQLIQNLRDCLPQFFPHS